MTAPRPPVPFQTSPLWNGVAFFEKSSGSSSNSWSEAIAQMYTRLRFLAHYRSSPQVCISLHNFKYAGSTPAFYPHNSCDSHSSPHSGNPEGIFIAVNFRCFPFPHGACLRTGRFPWYLIGEGLTSGLWSITEVVPWNPAALSLKATSGDWQSLAQVSLSTLHPALLVRVLHCLEEQSLDGPLARGWQISFSFPVPGQERWKRGCFFSYPFIHSLLLSHKLGRISSLCLDVKGRQLLPSSGHASLRPMSMTIPSGV